MYARSHSDDFAFGPLDLGSLERNGLTISGPDLAAVRKVLAKVPGLTEEVPDEALLRVFMPSALTVRHISAYHLTGSILER